MHRVIHRGALRHRTQKDRGASAVLVGLLLVPLLGFAALAIDIAAMHADKQLLQTGADAAALAVAQDCAKGECGDPDATASEMATQNNPFGGSAWATITRLDTDEGVVTVRTESSRNHFLAPIIGIDDADIAAAATARWGYPSSGAAVLPFTLGACEILSQVPGLTAQYDDAGNIIRIDFPEDAPPVTVEFTKTNDVGDCTGPSGLAVPGGFGWLDPGAGCTGPVATIDSWVQTSVGNTLPQGCSNADFLALIGETVLIPIFDQAVDNGTNAQYHIIGFAAFTLTEYYFGGQNRSPGGQGLCAGMGGGGGGGSGGNDNANNARCLQGTFERFVDASGEYELDPDAPQLGAAIVRLTLN